MPTPPTNPGEALASRLLAHAGVAALAGAKVYPSKPTQDPPGGANPWPYLVYFRTGGGDGKNLAGRTRLQNYAMRVDCYATTQAAAEQIAAAVAAALDGWADRDNGVQGCFAAGDMDEQTTEDGSQVSGQTFSLWFAPVA